MVAIELTERCHKAESWFSHNVITTLELYIVQLHFAMNKLVVIIFCKPWWLPAVWRDTVWNVNDVNRTCNSHGIFRKIAEMHAWYLVFCKHHIIFVSGRKWRVVLSMHIHTHPHMCTQTHTNTHLYTHIHGCQHWREAISYYCKCISGISKHNSKQAFAHVSFHLIIHAGGCFYHCWDATYAGNTMSFF